MKKNKKNIDTKKEYKKIKRKKTISNLFNINIGDNFLKINEKELSVIFEIESFNIDILTKELQDNLADVFRTFYNIIRMPFEIHCVQIAKNFDEVETILLQKQSNAKNDYAAELFKINLEYLQKTINDELTEEQDEKLNAIKYYFKFIAKNKQEFAHINSCINSSFSIDCKVRLLERKELQILLNQVINFDYYDDYKLGLSSIEEQLIGAD